MNFTKEQVEKHVASVEKRLKSQEERKLQGYVLAKLCYQAGMHEDGIGYLSVKPRDYKAQKLMGQLYEARDVIAKAMEHYQKSLNLKKDQRDVIAALAELYCKAEVVRREDIVNCIAMVQAVFRSHPVLLTLNEKLLAITGKPDPASVENMLSKQLVLHVEVPPLELLHVEVSPLEVLHVEVPPLELLHVEVLHVEVPPLEVLHVEVPPLEVLHVEVPPLELLHVEVPTLELLHVEVPPLEVLHVEVPPLEVLHVEVPPLEVLHVEVPPLELLHVEVSTLELLHVEVPPLEVLHVEVPPLQVLHVELPPLEALHSGVNIKHFGLLALWGQWLMEPTGPVNRASRQMKALQYCQALNNTEAFFHHMEWQLCCADVAEACFEAQQSSGKSEPAAMLEVLVTLLECFTRIFELRMSGLFVAGDQYALLLKYDRLLSVGVKLISGQQSSIYTVVLRELAGQFYLMAGQFMHLCWLKAVEDRVQTGANSDLHMKLSVACLMASLKALPPSLLRHGEKEVKVMERWHLLACSRLCVVGHQLDLFKRHSPNYSESLDHFDQGQHLLAKALFMGDWASSTFVKLGSQKITYSLQQSFVAMDDALKTLRPNLPNADELLMCDEAFIKTHGPNVKAIVWLCLVYMAVDVDPPVTEWLATLFPDMNQATRDLKNCEVSTLSLHDLEAFLALVTYQTVVSCGPSDALSHWPEDAADWLLPHMAQKDWFPYCLAIPESDLSWWKCVIELKGGSLSVYKASAVKRELQEGLGKIRAARPLRLETGQLTTLARYFKLKADRMIEMGRDDPLNYRSVIMEFLDRSCHYWTQLVGVVEETLQDLLPRKRRTLTPSRASAASKEADSHLVLKSSTAGLLEEATMSLAGAAMYRQDTTKALLLYDKVKTPHAAFNQSKIYCLLAGNTAANGVEGREENLQKALDMVTRAIERLPSTGDPELREQLESHKNELEQLVSDIRPNESSVSCTLEYDDDDGEKASEQSASVSHSAMMGQTTLGSLGKAKPLLNYADLMF
ncbi:hypothetical protein EMCRGX_G025181 [Ephydatia muelleri]